MQNSHDTEEKSTRHTNEASAEPPNIYKRTPRPIISTPQSIVSAPTRPELNMGNHDSKDTSQSGDHDVTIIQTQEVHTNLLADHDTKLLILIIMVGIQLIITVWMLIKNQLQKQATKAARAAISPV